MKFVSRVNLEYLDQTNKTSTSRPRWRSPGDRARLEIRSTPGIARNIHRIEVEADSARFSITIENVPSENPRTGKITALSAIACLRGLVGMLKVGG